MNETGQEKKLSETEKDVNRIDAFSNIVKQNHDFERGAESAMDVVNNRKYSDTTVSDMVKTAGMMKAKSMSPATPAKRGKKELNDPLMSRRTFNKIAIASLTGVGIVAVLTKYGSLVEKIATFIANNINDKKNNVKLITEVEAKAAEIALYVNPEIENGDPKTVISDLKKYFSDIEIAYLAHNANDDFYFQKITDSENSPSYTDACKNYLESNGVEIDWTAESAAQKVEIEFKKLLDKKGFVKHADNYINVMQLREEEEQKKNGGLGL